MMYRSNILRFQSKLIDYQRAEILTDQFVQHRGLPISREVEKTYPLVTEQPGKQQSNRPHSYMDWYPNLFLYRF